MNKICEIRVTDAQESLSRVQHALKLATTRRSAAAALEGDLRKLVAVNPWIGMLDSFISYCDRIADDYKGATPLPSTKIAEAATALRQLKSNLRELAGRAAKLKESSFNEDQLKIHLARTKDLIESKSQDLGEVSEQVQQNQLPPRQLLANIDAATPFWGEHIATVAGMVLRDERFDEGLCHLADQLTILCRGSHPFGLTDTLNILGGDHFVLKDLNYTVYFRFPIWSVWGLPFTAHGFWHATSRGLLEVDRLKRRFVNFPEAAELWKESLVQDCLADTFATFVMGPAYAFACILLLLDVNSPQHRLRAETIFATLDHLAIPDKDKPWYEFAEALKTCWKEATAGVQPEPPVCSSAPTQAKAPLPLVDSNSIERMRTIILGFMPDKLRYSTGPWSVAGAQLSSLLADNDEDAWTAGMEKFQIPKGLDIRHILHVGWLTRWNEPTQSSERIKTLASRVVILCGKVAGQTASESADPDDKNAAVGASLATFV